MYIFKDTIKTKYIGPDDCIIDIESSGVDRDHCKVLVCGLLFDYKTKNKDNFIQLCLLSDNDEKDLLKKLLELTAGKNLISFNGEIFDLPFINSRCKKLGLGQTKEKSQLDLYRYFIVNKIYRSFSSRSLQDIERDIGIKRFEDFEIKKDQIFYSIDKLTHDRKKVCLHNKYDVINTELLMDEYYKTENEKTIFIKNNKFLISDFTYTKDFCNIILTDLDDFYEGDFIFENNIYFLEKKDNLIFLRFYVMEGYVKKDILGLVHENNFNIIDCSPYKLPQNLLTILADSKLIIKNTVNLIEKIFHFFGI